MRLPLRLLLAASLACSGNVAHAAARSVKTEQDVIRSARVYHIMLRDQASAQALRDRLLLPADTARNGLSLARFKQAATEESLDPGSARQGGDLGLVQEGAMVKEFEQAVFALQPRQLSDPVPTRFGWHLILVTEVESRPVRQICEDSLAAAVKHTPKGPDRSALLSFRQALSQEQIHASVQQHLGPGWSEPMRSPHEDLVYWRMQPIPGDPARVRAQLHIEYPLALYNASPVGCRRSARRLFEVDCTGQTVTFLSREEFEGRGAIGRKLFEMQVLPADLHPEPATQGLYGQLLANACPTGLGLQAQAD